MVSTFAPSMGYGCFTDYFNCTTRLPHALLPHVVFADTMSHGTLLGVAVAGVLQLPMWVGVASLAILLVCILWILHDRRLPNDALLALCAATLLCSGLMLIQNLPALRPELLSYLFGDLLTISWSDLPVFAAIIVVSVGILWKFWSAQIQIAIDPDIAISEG
jgi:zinc transport system permease protein